MPPPPPRTLNAHSFLKIDCHTHIIPPNLGDLQQRFGDYISWPKTSGEVPRWGGGLRFDGECFYGTRNLLKHWESNGVDVQVASVAVSLHLCRAKPEHALWVHRRVNDHIASMVREHPTRFVGLGVLPLQSAELAIRELHRCVNELGLVGIAVPTFVNDWNLDHPELMKIWAEVNRLNLCIFVHPDVGLSLHAPKTFKEHRLYHTVGVASEGARVITVCILGEIFERYPTIRWCFSHGGGTFAAVFGRVEKLCELGGHPVVPRDYLGHFFVDSLTCDENVLNLLVKLVGEDMVVLGSDHPFPWDPASGEWVHANKYMNARSKQKILWDNGFRWLGVDPAPYVPGAAHRQHAKL